MNFTLSLLCIFCRLNGQVHLVYTGVVLVWNNRSLKPGESENQVYMDDFYEMTKVEMAKLSPEIISAYVSTGEPL